MPTPKHPKAWILTQNQDYTPTGVLQLGQVLTNFMDPNSAILASGTVPIPDKTLRDQSIHRGVDYASTESHQLSFRAWLKIFDRADASASADLTDAAKAKFSGKILSVFLFHPSSTYAKDSLALADRDGSTAPITVPWYKAHARVWLVTGLRVLGKGTKVNEAFVERASGNLAVQVDATAAGANVPLTAGAGATAASGRAASHTIQDSDPFVYAYRLHEIIVRRKVGTSTATAFEDGEVSGTGSEAGQNGENKVNVAPGFVGYEFVAVESEAFDGDGDPANPLFVD